MPLWIWSLFVFGLAAAGFLMARRKASQPWDPLRPRMIDYVLVQLLCMVIGVVALTVTAYLLGGAQPHLRPW